MSLPVLTLHLAQSKLAAYCAQKLPPELHDQVRLEVEIEGENLTLIESRPHFRTPETWTRLPVARFRYNPGSGAWSLYSPHLGKSEKWQTYPAKPERDIGKLIALVDADDTGVFWG